jgi:phospholipase/lecithinase/hemolysin
MYLPKEILIGGNSMNMKTASGRLSQAILLRGVAWLSLGVVSILAIGTSPLAATDISQLVIFGDSLSDTGNSARSLSTCCPRPPYFDGRFSNGPVWVDRLAERLGVPIPVASLLGGTNYAFGGGTTGSIYRGPVIEDMNVQVERYLTAHAPAADELFVFWGGANDFNAGQRDPSLPVEFLSEQVTAVAEAGARNILVVNLPASFGQSDYPLAGQFNQLLSDALTSIASTHESVSIFQFDYFSFFNSVLTEPNAFGFSNMTDPACADCGFGVTASPSNIVSNPDAYFSWDDIHPSATAHQLIGNAAFDVLAGSSLLGDVNGDGDVNGLDVDPFVDVLLSGPYQPEADMNEDQVVNGLDVDPFVAAVVGGTQQIPEPSTLLLGLLALGVVGAWRKWGG